MICCQVSDFQERFDVGVGLHACGPVPSSNEKPTPPRCAAQPRPPCSPHALNNPLTRLRVALARQATDLIHALCLAQRASYVLAPCCYGFIARALDKSASLPHRCHAPPARRSAS